MSANQRPAGSRAAFGNLLVAAALLAAVTVLVAWQPPAPLAMTGDVLRWATAAATLLLYAGFCMALWQVRRRRLQPPAAAGDDAILVIHASQTGRAEAFAQQTAEALRSAGRPVQLLALSALDPQRLAAASQALFVASTTGEGDAPDACYRFVQQQMPVRRDLACLHYGLLALGDSSYRNYCAFGRALDQWLQHCGARPLFDRVEVDDRDDGALRHWQQQLRTLAGEDAAEATPWADWAPPAYQAWRLIDRECVNPGSLGQPVYRLGLRAQNTDDAIWQAGDIAEIGPRNDPDNVATFGAALGVDLQQRLDGESLREALSRRHLPRDAALDQLRGLAPAALLQMLPLLPHREYSIASLPDDGRLELLVRQMRHSDGRLGHGSGWLSAWAPLQADIALRIRRNAGFHLDPQLDAPLLLIGNGTGIAGLRAHWRARIAAGQMRNWLVFGERQQHCDFHFADEIGTALRAGQLVRVDAVFSRDGGPHRYVQDLLRDVAAELRDYVADGAYVLVCGSLAGMAPAVDAVLRDVLGEQGYARLLAENRYRRDVY